MDQSHTKVYEDFLSTLRTLHCPACGENPDLHSGIPGRTDILQCLSCRVLVEIPRPDKPPIFADMTNTATKVKEVFITEWDLQMLIKTKHVNQELAANGFPPLPITPDEDILPNHKCDVCRI